MIFLSDRETLISNLDKLHTTEMGVDRIRNNLELPPDADVVDYCKRLIKAPDCNVYRNGKNFYCVARNAVVTVNASSYSIITAE